MLNLLAQSRDRHRTSAADGDLALTEHAIAALREHLRDAGLAEWRIFHGSIPYLFGIDLVLDRLDPSAVWECTDGSLVGPEALVTVTFEDGPHSRARAWQSGVLQLRKLQVLVARWYWHDPVSDRKTAFYLLAAPRVECLETLRQQLVTLNRQTDCPVWRIAGQYGSGATVPREQVGNDALVLGDELRGRVQTDILGFFTPAIAAMYQRLNVPYRRGVLLHGEPGNGKTSLIRYVGAKLPGVAGILLRAAADFDTDTLSDTFDTWKQLAPAVLVIEDLTAVLERVNLSTLLNLL